MLECVLSKREAKKLHRYNLLKMPLLREPLFLDDGKPNLMSTLHQARKEFLGETESERFMKKAMNNPNDYSKAKWQIENSTGVRKSTVVAARQLETPHLQDPSQTHIATQSQLSRDEPPSSLPLSAVKDSIMLQQLQQRSTLMEISSALLRVVPPEEQNTGLFTFDEMKDVKEHVQENQPLKNSAFKTPVKDKN